MMTFEPAPQATQQQAIEWAQQFSAHVQTVRAQNKNTAQLAQQLRQRIQQAIQGWSDAEQTQFMQWFNAALLDVNAVEKTDMASSKFVGFYFAIVATILAVSFVGLAVFAALMDAKTFNGG